MSPEAQEEYLYDWPTALILCQVAAILRALNLSTAPSVGLDSVCVSSKYLQVEGSRSFLRVFIEHLLYASTNTGAWNTKNKDPCPHRAFIPMGFVSFFSWSSWHLESSVKKLKGFVSLTDKKAAGWDLASIVEGHLFFHFKGEWKEILFHTWTLNQPTDGTHCLSNPFFTCLPMAC